MPVALKFISNLQKRIEISGGKDTSWLRHVYEAVDASGSVQDSFDHDVNAALDLTDGATLWLARRRRKPEVGSLRICSCGSLTSSREGPPP